MPLLSLLSFLLSKVKFPKLGLNVVPTQFLNSNSCGCKLRLVSFAGNTVIDVVLEASKLVLPLDIGVRLETFDLGFHSF